MDIEKATPDELPDVLNVIDNALLEVATPRVRTAIEDGDVLVARDRDGDHQAKGGILGALVVEGNEITAVAVRRRRRNAGIGAQLVGKATELRPQLCAQFDARVRPFWESFDCDIEPVTGSERFRAVFECRR